MIYRPGCVCGHSISGASNTNDATSLLLCGLLQCGIVCTDSNTPLPTSFNLCPVDFVSNTIVTSAFAAGTVVHVCAPYDLSLDTLCQWMQEAGHVLQRVSPDLFMHRVKFLTEDNLLYPFISSFLSHSPSRDISSTTSSSLMMLSRVHALYSWHQDNNLLTEVRLAASLRFLMDKYDLDKN